MGIIYCDSHTHLTDAAFDGDRKAVLDRAGKAGLGLLVEIGCSPAEWEPALELSRASAGGIFCALGIHPQYCEAHTPQNLLLLERLLQSPQARALGEVGLDYARNSHLPPAQKKLFADMLALAKKTGKPLVLHCRNPFPGQEGDAYCDALDMLEAAAPLPSPGGKTGIMHCFSGTEKDARRALALGFLLGVNGTLTYKKNHELRRIIASAGLENLALETDCPYLPPQSSRGKRNEPAAIPEIAAALARELGMGPEPVARATLENTRRALVLA